MNARRKKHPPCPCCFGDIVEGRCICCGVVIGKAKNANPRIHRDDTPTISRMGSEQVGRPARPVMDDIDAPMREEDYLD